MTGLVELWRISAETSDYKANDLTGGGAAKFPGRWNAKTQRVVYCAKNISLAVLETAAHIDDAGLPLNRYVVRIEVPITIWNARVVLERASLDAAWCAIPFGRASIDAGAEWYSTAKSALLEVPSVVVPEESTILINAEHADANLIAAKTIRLFEYNRLFRPSALATA